MLQLDEWQKDFIASPDDKILVSGRQTGKSEAMAYDAAQFALTHGNSTTLIISRTERQAQELLIKALNFLHEINKNAIAKGKDRPTQSRVNLKNGAQLLSLPTGIAGEGIRYLTIHKLLADEAQLIPDDVFTAVTPMLLTTGGKISLSGTPQGKRGFFWKAYENSLSQWKVFQVNSEQVVAERPISDTWQQWRKDAALNHLAREKARMSIKQYAQEYLGMFVEDLNQFFPDELIKKCCILKRPLPPALKENNFLGVDIGRLGGDETTYEIINRFKENHYRHVESIVKKQQLTTQTEQEILGLNLIWQPIRIGIDAGSGSLGVGLYDRFMDNPQTKRIIVAMNNRKISLDRDGKSKQRIFKEDMYDNLLAMMERGEILLLDDNEVETSLKSVQVEFADEDNSVSKVRIFGSYTHIAEGLIRSAYLAKKEKINKLAIYYV